ncbi:MAG: DUF1854 domain-containing protein [Isosphaeraceae bacterium]
MNNEPALATKFGLSLDPWGRLVLIDAEGRRYVGVEPVRAFPITDPGHWISILNAEGGEILCIENLAELSPATRQILEQELGRREFVPLIQKIERVSGDSLPSDWTVLTDRGRTRFTLDSDDHIRKLGDGRVLITDPRGLRFQITDTRALDAHSRRLLERFL